jgi:hypothetical protein
MLLAMHNGQPHDLFRMQPALHRRIGALTGGTRKADSKPR